MPRKPKFDHPLRVIRTAAGLTQNKLATLLGTSPATVQSIELGRLKMRSELALKTARQTGCALTSKKGKNPGYAISVRSAQTLAPYTKEDFNLHQKSMKSLAAWEFENHTDAAVCCIELLFRIAVRRGMGTVLSIAQDFELFVAKAYKDYDLKKSLVAELRENWLPFNKEFPLEREVANFPIIPLKVASSFPRRRPVNPETAEKAEISGAGPLKKVMPK